jgi:DNA-binding IclR family transcriptional regulator
MNAKTAEADSVILAALLREHGGTTADISKTTGIDRAKVGRRLRALTETGRVTKRGDYWFSLEPDALMLARVRREARDARSAKSISLAETLGLVNLTPSLKRDDEDDDDYEARLASERRLLTRRFDGYMVEIDADDFIRIAEELVRLRAKR